MSTLLLAGGTIVTAQRFFRADLRVRRGLVVEIGSGLRPGRNEAIVDCSSQYVYPGLINAHDHLAFNLFPRLGDPPYGNAHEWGTDILRRHKETIDSIKQIPLRDRLFWGAWKNLFSGVTTVVHHDPYYTQFRFQFPIDVLRRYTYAHSFDYEINMQLAISNRRKGVPFIVHLAEGTDTRAAEEVSKLKHMGGLDNRTVIVHGVAIREEDIYLLVSASTSVIWCPGSNYFLFNRTAPVESLKGKVPIAIGTDSTLSGSESLFDELRAAGKEGSFTTKELFAMVTDIPRKIFELSTGAGMIHEGGRADLFLLHAKHEDPYATLLEAQPGDLNLLLRRGNVIFHDDAFACNLTSTSYYKLSLNERKKCVCHPRFGSKYEKLSRLLKHYSYLPS